MPRIAKLLLGAVLAVLLAVGGHAALTGGSRMEGPVGRFAAGTCAACH